MRKFVPRVAKISFNGALAENDGRQVLFVTERAVIELSRSCLRLVEIAPGIDLERDVIDRIDAALVVGSDVRLMDPELFT